jgi:hypothetical protein
MARLANWWRYSVRRNPYLTEHSVKTAYEEGWSTLSNGELLRSAAEEGYHLLLTTDQNLRYQQNLQDRQIAIVVLLSTSWPQIRLHIDSIRAVVIR